MIPCDRTFDGRETYEDNGITYRRWFYPEWTGDYDLTFRILSVNSPLPQGIEVHFSNDFKGFLEFRSQKLPRPKSKFGHYSFHVDDFPKRQFTLKVRSASGKLVLTNSCKNPDFDIWDSAVHSCAMWVEMLADNHYRFHCNDREFDDDFDDLVFDVVVSAML